MNSWPPTTPIDLARLNAMRVHAGAPGVDRSWTELPSPARLATAPSVAKGAALVFPRDCGSLQPVAWIAVLGNVRARICRLAVAMLAALLVLSGMSAASAADDLVQSGTLTIE